MHTRSSLISIGILVILVLGACNIPNSEQEEPEDTVATWVASTLTEQAIPVPKLTSTSTPEVNVTFLAAESTATEGLPTSTPQNPLVLQTILCWKGPGDQYEVVSALKKDERVELIGQGSLAGWWIVNNPIYHDPCWSQAEYIQIEPGYNTAALPVYTPPPSPTPSPSNTPMPTSTPTATNTP